jgi:hypothetical protein
VSRLEREDISDHFLLVISFVWKDCGQSGQEWGHKGKIGEEKRE